MYSLTVSYPKTENDHFDFDYYENSHLALVKDKFASFGLHHIILKTNVGSKPGGEDQYFASVDLVFDSIDSLNAALASAGKEINADVVNYTSARAKYAFSALSLLNI